MSILQLLGELASAAVEGLGAHQMQQEQPAPRRALRRKEGCTPCAAMADVDKARAQLGFGGASSKRGKAQKAPKLQKAQKKA